MMMMMTIKDDLITVNHYRSFLHHQPANHRDITRASTCRH